MLRTNIYIALCLTEKDEGWKLSIQIKKIDSSGNRKHKQLLITKVNESRNSSSKILFP